MINYTSAEKVLNRLPKVVIENEDKNTLLSWIYAAYNELKIPQGNQEKCCLLTLDNYNAQLCSDVKSIIFVTKFNTDCVPFSLEPYLEEEETDCVGNYLLSHKVFLDSADYKDSFIPLKYVGNSSYVSKDCLNRDLHCNDTYSVDQHRILTSSLKEGQLCIVYNSHVRDEDGNLMIADNEDVIRYLSYVCNYHHLLNRSMRDERVLGQLDRAERSMNAYYRKARGSAIMKSVNFKSLSELTTDSFNAIMLKYPGYART